MGDYISKAVLNCFGGSLRDVMYRRSVLPITQGKAEFYHCGIFRKASGCL